MTLTLAYECYADEDIVLFLRDECNLPLLKQHSFSQGEVVNDLLRREQADMGMVDEDPGSSHHSLRDRMQVRSQSPDMEVRRMSGRHLVILKPELEECFIRSMNRVALPLTIASTPKELQRVLNVPRHPSHVKFREELLLLYRAAKDRHIQTFITDLELVIRALI